MHRAMVSPLQNIPQPLAFAIDRAGTRNAVDFDYLVETAKRESSLNPQARASASSATGLFQFIDSTWLEVMKAEGPRLGYGDLAGHIEERGGDLVVRDPQIRQQILDLRTDPQVASDMAAAFTRRNGEYLQDKFGRMPSPGELYIAHFLGVRGAERFFQAGLEQPNANAAELFPAPAAANRSIFYDNGRPRSVREVYEVLVARHGGGSTESHQPTPTPETANAGFVAQQMTSDRALPSRFEIDAPLPPGVSFTSLFSTKAEQTHASPVSQREEGQHRPLFNGFYSGQ